MTALRPTRSERAPASGIVAPAGSEKAVMTRPISTGVRPRRALRVGSTGISMELPSTITKGTAASTANQRAVSPRTSDRPSSRLHSEGAGP